MPHTNSHMETIGPNPSMLLKIIKMNGAKWENGVVINIGRDKSSTRDEQFCDG